MLSDTQEKEASALLLEASLSSCSTAWGCKTARHRMENVDVPGLVQIQLESLRTVLLTKPKHTLHVLFHIKALQEKVLRLLL